MEGDETAEEAIGEANHLVPMSPLNHPNGCRYPMVKLVSVSVSVSLGDCLFLIVFLPARPGDSLWKWRRKESARPFHFLSTGARRERLVLPVNDDRNFPQGLGNLRRPSSPNHRQSERNQFVPPVHQPIRLINSGAFNTSNFPLINDFSLIFSR